MNDFTDLVFLRLAPLYNHALNDFVITKRIDTEDQFIPNLVKMRKVRSPYQLILLVVLFAGFSVQLEGAEEIRSFHSDIRVRKDGRITVTETIRVKAEGRKIKHGIYRDLPTKFQDSRGNTFSMFYSVKSIKRDGKPEPYTVQAYRQKTRVYIGDEDRPLEDGIHTYRITYETASAIRFLENHDELYWNVTGHAWDFPVEEVQATVRLPESVSERALQVSGYTGYEGQKNENYKVLKQEQGKVVVGTTKSMNMGRGLTISVAWPKGIVREPGWSERLSYYMNDNRVVLFGLLGLLILLGYYFVTWMYVGEDPDRGMIRLHQEPPEGLSPAAMRYLMEMEFDDRTFTSGLVNLCVQGFAEIEQSGGEIVVRKQTERIREENLDVKESMSPAEAVLFEKLFESGDKVRFDDEHRDVLKVARDAMEKELEEEYNNRFFLTNTGYFTGGVLLSLLLLGTTVHLGYVNATAIFMTFLVMMIVAGIWIAPLLERVYRKWRKFHHTSRGFTGAFSSTVYAGVFLAVLFYGGGYLIFRGGLQIVTLVLLYSLVNGVFYVLLKAPTVQGRKLMDQILGFKRFLKSRDTSKKMSDHATGMLRDRYEQYLPYALALDVSTDWTKSLSHALQPDEKRDLTGYRPHWYRGQTHEIDRFPQELSIAVSSSIASVTAPEVSGGGGTGSAGGGAGGGGGGGW